MKHLNRLFLLQDYFLVFNQACWRQKDGWTRPEVHISYFMQYLIRSSVLGKLGSAFDAGQAVASISNSFALIIMIL